tara:strand:+ start:49 stop:753 length:705 start_codon:yes stop_codon:yes gene_type:complete
MIKKLLLILAIVFGLSQITKAQVISCVPCNQLGMVMNVGSQQTAISIYHSGQYMTHPRSQNIFTWEFSDQQGNILHLDTLVDASTISFGHNWSLTDTINVTVHFVNDSAILPSGNSINCLFEDQIYWSTGSSTPWGSWTFIHNNPGVDVTDINQITILEPDFIIFPSPTSNNLNVKGPNEEYALKILNVQGQMFYEINNISGHQNIDVSFLPSGLYFLNVSHNKGYQNIRFIKQ